MPDRRRLAGEVLAREVSLGSAPEGAGARGAGDRIACGVIRR